MSTTFHFEYKISGWVEASTLEDAKQKVDNAVDLNELKGRGLTAKREVSDVTEIDAL